MLNDTIPPGQPRIEMIAGSLRPSMVRGANAILALLCCHLNGRFEDYWEARRAA